MPLTQAEISRLLEVIRDTQDVEIDCDSCLMQVGEFATQHLTGMPIDDGLRAVSQHLRICDECKEEFEALCLALAAQEGSDQR